MDIIVYFVCKCKMLAIIKNNGINLSNLMKLDTLKTFTQEDLRLEEQLKKKVGNDSAKLKHVLNILSVGGYVQSQSSLNIHLPQFDALCRRIWN